MLAAGYAFVSRRVTQMYFPGDPLLEFDPIYKPALEENAHVKMISSFDLDDTELEWALCCRFDIVLRGRDATPMETNRCLKQGYRSVANWRRVVRRVLRRTHRGFDIGHGAALLNGPMSYEHPSKALPMVAAAEHIGKCSDVGLLNGFDRCSPEASCRCEK